MKTIKILIFVTFMAVVAPLAWTAAAQEQKAMPAKATEQTPASVKAPVTATTSAPAPATTSVAAPAVVEDGSQYIIGPEDVLDISVWKEAELSKQVIVRADGKISLPLIDDVLASGLTPLQLKDLLAAKFKNFIDSPTVSVIVKEANSFKVYVSGEVKQPGIHRIRSEVTLMKLITQVGGFTEWANQKKILILRKEKGEDKRIKANYKDIVDGDQPDIIIKSGDTVIVP